MSSSAAAASLSGTVTGLTVLSFREWLEAKFGDAGLATILAQPELPREHAAVFMEHDIGYQSLIPERAYLSVILATMQMSGLTQRELLFEFGEFFLDWMVDRSGYHQAIKRVSNTFHGFARYLNPLLVQMYATLGNPKPGLPQVQVTDVTPSSFTLGAVVPDGSSSSRNVVLLSVYQGMLHNAATQAFGIRLEFSNIAVSMLSMGQEYLACQVKVSGQDIGAADEGLLRSSGHQPWRLPTMQPLSQPGGGIMGLDPDAFEKLFPFHFVLDLNFRVLQAGEALKRMLPQMGELDTDVREVLTIRLPRLMWSMDCLQGLLQSDMRSKVVMTSGCGIDLHGGLHVIRQMRRDPSQVTPMSPKGCLVDGDETLVFLGSPYIANIEDMERHDLFLSDFPPHEAAADHVLMAAPRHAKTTEALREAQRNAEALKETLAEALAVQADEAGRRAITIESAGHMTLRLLDSLLMGNDMSVQEVLDVRAALLRAGTNLWRPLDVDWAQAVEGDKEVNEALAKLLGAPMQRGQSSEPHLLSDDEDPSATAGAAGGRVLLAATYAGDGDDADDGPARFSGGDGGDGGVRSRGGGGSGGGGSRPPSGTEAGPRAGSRPPSGAGAGSRPPSGPGAGPGAGRGAASPGAALGRGGGRGGGASPAASRGHSIAGGPEPPYAAGGGGAGLWGRQGSGCMDGILSGMHSPTIGTPTAAAAAAAAAMAGTGAASPSGGAAASAAAAAAAAAAAGRKLSVGLAAYRKPCGTGGGGGGGGVSGSQLLAAYASVGGGSVDHQTHSGALSILTCEPQDLTGLGAKDSGDLSGVGSSGRAALGTPSGSGGFGGGFETLRGTGTGGGGRGFSGGLGGRRNSSTMKSWAAGLDKLNKESPQAGHKEYTRMGSGLAPHGVAWAAAGAGAAGEGLSAVSNSKGRCATFEMGLVPRKASLTSQTSRLAGGGGGGGGGGLGRGDSGLASAAGAGAAAAGDACAWSRAPSGLARVKARITPQPSLGAGAGAGDGDASPGYASGGLTPTTAAAAAARRSVEAAARGPQGAGGQCHTSVGVHTKQAAAPGAERRDCGPGVEGSGAGKAAAGARAGAAAVAGAGAGAQGGKLGMGAGRRTGGEVHTTGCHAWWKGVLLAFGGRRYSGGAARGGSGKAAAAGAAAAAAAVGGGVGGFPRDVLGGGEARSSARKGGAAAVEEEEEGAGCGAGRELATVGTQTTWPSYTTLCSSCGGTLDLFSGGGGGGDSSMPLVFNGACSASSAYRVDGVDGVGGVRGVDFPGEAVAAAAAAAAAAGRGQLSGRQQQRQQYRGCSVEELTSAAAACVSRSEPSPGPQAEPRTEPRGLALAAETQAASGLDLKLIHVSVVQAQPTAAATATAAAAEAARPGAGPAAAGGALAAAAGAGAVVASAPVGAVPVTAKRVLPPGLLVERVASTGPDGTPLVMRLLLMPGDKLNAILSKADDWQFDSFALEAAANGRSLSCLGFHLIKRMGLVQAIGLDETKLARFLMHIEDGYGANPYHCKTHAADVLRSLHAVLTKGEVLTAISLQSSNSRPHRNGMDHDTSVRLLTCYLSAIVHDYEHRGLNNDFLIKSSDHLAMLYNDQSPLENHHVSAAFRLLQQEQFDFLPPGSKRVRDALRRDAIDLVLATDMKQHFALTGTFSLKVAAEGLRCPETLTRGESTIGALRRPLATPRVAGGSGDDARHSHQQATIGPTTGPTMGPTMGPAGRLRSTASTAGVSGGPETRDSNGSLATLPPHEGWDRETQILVLKMALKAADLGHLTSSTDVHKQWVARLEEELFRQGDQEKAVGQPVSPLMDRTKTGITKSQCGFFNIVARPMYQSFVQAFPASKPLLLALDANYESWKAIEAQAQGEQVAS